MHLASRNVVPVLSGYDGAHDIGFRRLVPENHGDIPSGDLRPHHFIVHGAALQENEALGADPHRNRAFRHGFAFGHPQYRFPGNPQLSVLQLSVKHVDGRRSEKLRHELIRRIVIDLLGRIHLLQHALLHDHNEVRNAHRLILVVRDKHRCDAGFLLDPPDLLPCRQTQSGIQIGERLIQEQDFGQLHQRTGNGHPLLLAARELRRFSLQQLLNVHQLRRFQHAFLHGLF